MVASTYSSCKFNSDCGNNTDICIVPYIPHPAVRIIDVEVCNESNGNRRKILYLGDPIEVWEQGKNFFFVFAL